MTKITAKYIDPQLNQITDQLSNFTDGTPFLLLPVRIETRFMKLPAARDLEANQTGGFEKSILPMAEGEVLLKQSTQGLSTANKNLILSRGTTKIKQASLALKSLNQISKKQKNWIAEYKSELDKVLVAKKKSNASRTLIKRMENALKDLNTNLQKFQGKKLIKDLTFKNAGNLLMQQKKLLNRIQLINKNKTPYQRVVQKKKLYLYIEKLVTDLKAFYTAFDKESRKLQFIDGSQVTALKLNNKKIITGLRAIPGRLAKIHKDKAWQKFYLLKRKELLKISSLISKQQKSTLPKLQTLSQSKQVRGNELFHKSLRLLVEVKTNVQRGPKDTAEGIRQQRQLKKHIKQVAKHTEREIKASPGQNALLNLLHRQLDDSIGTFRGQVRNLKNPLERKKTTSRVPLLRNLTFISPTEVEKSVANPRPLKETTKRTTVKTRSSKIRSTPFTPIDQYVFNDENRPVASLIEEDNELWVRIFPDDLHVHTHEEALTQEEIDAGKNYWKSVWKAADDEEIVLAAWRLVCTNFGVKRATWIIKALSPTKVDTAENRKEYESKPNSDLQKMIVELEALEKGFSRLQVIVKDPMLNTPVKQFNQMVKLLAKEEAAKGYSRINYRINRVKKVPNHPTFLQKATELLRGANNHLRLLSKNIQELRATGARISKTAIQKQEELVDNYQGLEAKLKSIPSTDYDSYIKSLTVPFTFPEVPLRDSDWTVAPHARVLPDRFVVLLKNQNEFSHIVVGEALPERLQLGMDPALFEEEDSANSYNMDSDGNLTVEPGLQWMTNFDEAISKGMGMKISIDSEEATTGFDQVFVIGLKLTNPDTKANLTTLASKKLLEDLLENHHYSPDGMSLLSIGTPTNNTEEEASGFSANYDDEDFKAAYEQEMGAPLFDKNASDVLDYADGKRLADALGIDASYLEHVPNSGQSEISEGFAFNRVLWNATLGDYLDEMWDFTFTPDNVFRIKDYFINNVSARGILPSLRIGSQPYGILPTTAFSKFSYNKNYSVENMPPFTGSGSNLKLRFNIRLQGMLKLLNEYWSAIRENFVNHAEKLEGLDDPQAGFMDLLGLHATSAEAYFRYGVNVADRGHDAESVAFSPNFTNDDDIGPFQFSAIFDSLFGEGYSDQPYYALSQSRIFRCRFLEDQAPITGEMIDGQSLQEIHQLIEEEDGNYIDWLLNNHPLDILANNDAESFQSKSLFYLLLRQTILIAYRNAALDILEHEQIITPDFRTIIGSNNHYRRPDGKYRTKWSYLFLDFSVTTSSQTGNFYESYDFDLVDNRQLSDSTFYNNYLKPNAQSLDTYLYRDIKNGSYPEHQPYTAELDVLRTDLTRLATYSTQKLDQLLREHIDLCSYRLDAWQLGLANQRLESMRKTRKTGSFIGAYGWVENLRPGGVRKESAKVPQALKDESAKIYSDADNQGFIHAPSLNHAISAAVLRGGYQSNADETAGNKFAINLSSFRVRQGLQIIEGIASGLELSAILGFQFEKGLHERYTDVELDKFIYPFRRAYPLELPLSDELTANDVEEAYNSNVVDGMAMLEDFNEKADTLDLSSEDDLLTLLSRDNFSNCPSWLTDLVRNNGGGDTELTAIIQEILHLADAFDALGDLAVSESVYQMVQGNHVRAAAVLQALAAGKAIPKPLIVDTPRTGIVVNHKVVLPMTPVAFANTKDFPVWSSTSYTLRAETAATFNKYLGDLFGPAGDIRFMISADEETTTHSMQEFDLMPVDLFYTLNTDRDSTQSELADFLLYHYRKSQGISSEVSLSIDFQTKDNAWASSVKTVYQLQPLVEQVKAMALNALPLDASELDLPPTEATGTNPGKQDLEEMVSRINNAMSVLNKLLLEVTAFLDQNLELIETDVSYEEGVGLLERAFYFGLPNNLNSVSLDFEEDNARMVHNKLKVLKSTLLKKQRAVDNISSGIITENGEQKNIKKWIAIGQAILGNSFVILPLFQFDKSSSFANQITPGSTSLQINDTSPFVMDQWLTGIAKVRKKMTSVEWIRMIQSMDDQSSTMSPVQLPFETGDYWLGIDYPESHKVTGDKLSLIIWNSDLLVDGSINKAGIVVDEWVEIIPNKTEVSGVTFNYDQPDARPPQSILLAIAPELTGKWDWDALVHTLEDTLELAKNRAVEPEHLDKSVFGQVLPTIISEVVPPELKADGFRNPLGTQVVLDYVDNQIVEEEED